MGTMQCPQCGREISDQGVSCPHCGFSVRVARLGHYLEKRQSEYPRTYRVLKVLFTILVFGLVLWLLTRR
jgi:predicted amidophosphoribosyltransferase